MLENEEKEKEVEENFPEKPDYATEIAEIIRSGAAAAEIRDKLSDYHENDIADVLDLLTEEERKKLYGILGDETTSDVFAYLEEDVATYLEELDNEHAADIIESMDADDAIDVLEELKDEQREELIELLDDEAKQDIHLIQSFDEDEIGSRMTTNFIVIRKGLTVRQAMKELVEQAAENDNISTLYVIDTDETFYGAISLNDLIIARDYVDLETLISTSYPYVYANEQITECIEVLKDYSEDSIPVLDQDKKLLGIITSQDIVEVVDEEMSEDYAKLAGLTEEEDLQEPLIESIKKRIPWLCILLFLSLGVSTVVGMFEGVVAQLTIVVSFQSLVLGMAGNAGTQSLAVTIRVLMDDDLKARQRRSLVLKEVRVGLTNGLLLGFISFVLIGLYVWLLKAKTMVFGFAVSGCCGLAMMVAMGISSFTGTMIPICLKKIGIDPAVASGPLITTINDLLAVVTYYGLTWILLLNVLQLVE